MRLKKALFSTLLLAVVLTSSCAVEPESDSYYSENRVMKAWINRYYPGLSTYGDTGAYLLEMEKGSGTAVTDSSYVRAHYTKRSLDGTITSTNIQELSEQLGEYSVSSWYGGNTWRVDQGNLPDGLEKALKSMNAGGHLKMAIPASASGHEYTVYSAFNSNPETENQVIDLTIDTVIANIYAYQEEIMREWFSRNYKIADTAALHLYFKKLEEHSAESDTISEGSTVSVRYIGRLMNGQVFDTNIEDTAKFYHIWDSSNSYNALTISYYKDNEEQFNPDNSVVTGFGKAVLMMNYEEKAVTLFSSQLGYGESGSNPSIPEYSPLVFWLWIEKK